MDLVVSKRDPLIQYAKSGVECTQTLFSDKNGHISD